MRENLVQSNAYYGLSIAGTRISPSDLIAFFSANWDTRVSGLDLSHMGWSFDELKQFAPYFRAEMSLRGYNMNDEQLIELMAIAEDGGGFQLFDVDLSDNQLFRRRGKEAEESPQTRNRWQNSLMQPCT